jgi:hypothetical protein
MYVQNITFCAGILEESLVAKNRVGIGLRFRLHRLAGLYENSVPYSVFSYQPIDCFKIPALYKWSDACGKKNPQYRQLQRIPGSVDIN